MHLLSSTSSFLLLGQMIAALPLLTPRLLPMVDDITCEIAGLQIADARQTLVELQRGAIQPPSDLSTDYFTNLLLGCLHGSGSGFGQHTSNFANPYGHQGDGGAGGDADPGAYGNTAGYPVTTSSFATEGPVSPSAPAENSGTALNPPSAEDNSQTADAAAAPTPPGDTGGDATAEDHSATNNAASASVDPPAAVTDVNTGNPPDNANMGEATVSHPPPSSPAAAAPSPASGPSTSPATVAPPSTAPTSSEPASPSDSPPASGPASSPDASFNPSGPRTANDAVSGTTGDGSSADTSVDAPSDNSVDANSSPYLPYDGAPGGADGTTQADNFGLDRPRHHSNHGASDATACDGIACVADIVAPANVAEAPNVGMKGLTNGNAGSCPSGDVDLCFDLGTR
ncbi:hypothetical protein PHLGIDRAFT_120127 [Phlebiopsis gigantea 11061_1 CR5-6]|uniref:Uncharacterized protein n=1 Tax=Phlebiopsis gigantea (strain 11061_1 CR5-6) TaxID=745531 RepID=A0A0C3NJI5_PHLG1|nr:hypothetical protein PHLGIDRAFT_120127 [Phlebiopsis gigantea 11061_1 CR5-6]